MEYKIRKATIEDLNTVMRLNQKLCVKDQLDSARAIVEVILARIKYAKTLVD